MVQLKRNRDYSKEWLLSERKSKSDGQIGKEVGVCSHTVRRWAIAWGIPARKRSECFGGRKTKYKPLDDKQWLEDLYLTKSLSTIEIAKLAGCSKGAVHYALVKHNIQTRSYDEATRIRDLVDRKGPNAANWKGGRWKTSFGYILIYNPDHPHSRMLPYVLEHRLVMEKHLGRYLKQSEVVHHINGDKSDNRLENLLMYDKHIEHKKSHKKLILENAELRKEIAELKKALRK